jgi:hypothetical protein
MYKTKNYKKNNYQLCLIKKIKKISSNIITVLLTLKLKYFFNVKLWLYFIFINLIYYFNYNTETTELTGCNTFILISYC